jgi:hypothetical protein
MNTVEYPAAVVCVQNEGNEVSLQLWKIYKPLRDSNANSEGFFRIIDESGEDYLFPQENFVPIELPSEAATVSGSVKRAAGAAKKVRRSSRAGRLT